MYGIHLLQRCEDAKSKTVAEIDSNRTFVLVSYEEVLQNANMFGMFFVLCLRNKGADEELLMLDIMEKFPFLFKTPNLLYAAFVSADRYLGTISGSTNKRFRCGRRQWSLLETLSFDLTCSQSRTTESEYHLRAWSPWRAEWHLDESWIPLSYLWSLGSPLFGLDKMYCDPQKDWWICMSLK